eukprot:gnl/TRDRNA2_/TRDRNA2_164587_c0_seq1.p1 gnl/TRDRNA2_/TRDRNA2_164587_c0~~gnl/TRDRNA2_/TRDRNA2_164587_c0_seq1.p1  ORF type:complete len:488 (-),score=57.93 gnl/TRDRNA2_/TRDRNA2_164587_c0_seq1:292-1542(-)
MMDAITLESAQQLMRNGAMAQIQPEFDELDRTSFGRLLAKQWREKADAYGHVDSAEMNVPLPNLVPRKSSWGRRVFMQMERAALQLQREIASVLIKLGLLMFGLLALVLGSPANKPIVELTQSSIALFLLMLAQSASAQRIFGGAERQVAWREAGANINTVFYFVGRDITALAELLLGTHAFLLIYWPLGPLLLNHHDMFWVIFAFLYCVWGVNYIWSILLPTDSAQMLAVVSSFLSYLFVGVSPAFVDLLSVMGGQGQMLMAASPMRWAYGQLMWRHMKNKMSSFSNPLIDWTHGAELERLGMPLRWIAEMDWSCHSASRGQCWQRWAGNPVAGVPPIGFVCSTRQLFLLGAYSRFVALVCLLVVSKSKAQGGGSLIEMPSSLRGSPMPRLLRRLFIIFLVILTHLQMMLLMSSE